MAYIIYSKKVDSYGDPRHEITRHSGLPEALHAYGEKVLEGCDEVILADELVPTATIEVRLGNSGASVKLGTD